MTVHRHLTSGFSWHWSQNQGMEGCRRWARKRDMSSFVQVEWYQIPQLLHSIPVFTGFLQDGLPHADWLVGSALDGFTEFDWLLEGSLVSLRRTTERRRAPTERLRRVTMWNIFASRSLSRGGAQMLQLRLEWRWPQSVRRSLRKHNNPEYRQRTHV